jgi:protein involved in ribonucleotide reduction
MIVFASRTGNVRSIVSQLGFPNKEIKDDLIISHPYLLFTYTDGLGNTPQKVVDFLLNENNSIYLRGVISSGNLNFGLSFCRSADEISSKYNVPIIRKIDLRGSTEDIEEIKKVYKKLIEVKN